MNLPSHLRAGAGVYSAPDPPWLEAARHAIEPIATLPDNWDGEGAPRIQPAVMDAALRVLEQLLPSHTPAPQIVPAHRAGIQVEWHRNGKDLEIEFVPGSPTTFYFYDSQTQVEREGALQSNTTLIRELADQLLCNESCDCPPLAS
jgi:hypothetical protein